MPQTSGETANVGHPEDGAAACPLAGQEVLYATAEMGSRSGQSVEAGHTTELEDWRSVKPARPAPHRPFSRRGPGEPRKEEAGAMAPSTGLQARATPGACLRCDGVGWTQVQPLHAAGEVYAGAHPIRVAAHPFSQPQPDMLRWPSAPPDTVRWQRHSPESPPRQDAAGCPATPTTPPSIAAWINALPAACRWDGKHGASATVDRQALPSLQAPVRRCRRRLRPLEHLAAPGLGH